MRQTDSTRTGHSDAAATRRSSPSSDIRTVDPTVHAQVVAAAPVVGQVSRSGRQVQLRRFLRGCAVVPFASEDAHVVGALAGTAGVADVVDVHLVVIAGRAQVIAILGEGLPRGMPNSMTAVVAQT